MSQRIYKSIDLPQGYRANPPTIAAAVAVAITDLEDKVIKKGLRPVWDTVEIQIEASEEFVDEMTFGGTVDRVGNRVTTGTVSVLALEKGEAE